MNKNFFRGLAAGFAILVLASLFVLRSVIIESAATRFRFPNAMFLSKDGALVMRVGNYYFNGGAYNLETALQAYTLALKINPDIKWAHYQIARIYFLKGDFVAALAEINKEVALHPENPHSFYVRGLIEGYAGFLVEAENDFRGFIEKEPNGWAGYNDLAWIQAKLGDFQGVQKTIFLAFERLPYEKDRNPWLWISLGIAYLNSGDYNNSKKALTAAERIVEKMDSGYFWSAYPGNDPRGAEGAFRQFRAVLHLNLGVVFEKLGELARAGTEYKTYISLISDGELPSKEEIQKKIDKLDARVK